MPPDSVAVHVIDDDEAVRQSLAFLLRANAIDDQGAGREPVGACRMALIAGILDAAPNRTQPGPNKTNEQSRHHGRTFN